MMNFYTLLGIEPEADPVQIQRAITAAEKTGQIDPNLLNAARNYLLNPQRREQYHQKMGIKLKGRVSAGDGFSGWIGWLALVLLLAGIMLIPTYLFLRDKAPAPVPPKATEALEALRQAGTPTPVASPVAGQ